MNALRLLNPVELFFDVIRCPDDDILTYTPEDPEPETEGTIVFGETGPENDEE